MRNQFKHDDIIFDQLACHVAFSEATGPDALEGHFTDQRANFHETYLPLMKKAREMQAAGMDAPETFEIIGRLLTHQAMAYGEMLAVEDSDDRVIEIDKVNVQFNSPTVCPLQETIQHVVAANGGAR